jgi:beta-lactamase regulating signal transducer with metallopeptidase domain
MPRQASPAASCRSCRTLGVMKRSVAKAVAILVCAGLLAGIAGCAAVVARYERAFEETRDSEPARVVIERFGTPSVQETATKPFVVYASNRCVAPCVFRLWWEHPVLKGIEAWSVEFGANNEVIHKAHWVSP